MISKNEYAPYFQPYIEPILANGKSIVENLEMSQQYFEDTLRTLPKEKQEHAYAEGKWTIKELIQHIIDTERIFCYRTLCFARNDRTALPGFDQDLFVEYSDANHRNYNDLLDEMSLLRKGTIQLFNSFSKDVLLRVGNASGKEMSVRALGYIISGHQRHHLNVVKERYL